MFPTSHFHNQTRSGLADFERGNWTFLMHIYLVDWHNTSLILCLKINFLWNGGLKKGVGVIIQSHQMHLRDFYGKMSHIERLLKIFSFCLADCERGKLGNIYRWFIAVCKGALIWNCFPNLFFLTSVISFLVYIWECGTQVQETVVFHFYSDYRNSSNVPVLLCRAYCWQLLLLLIIGWPSATYWDLLVCFLFIFEFYYCAFMVILAYEGQSKITVRFYITA